MIPETWLPTLTVVTAERAPVAVTAWVMSPWSTVTVRYFSAGFFRLPTRKKIPTAAASTIRTHSSFLFIEFLNLRRPGDVPGVGPGILAEHLEFAALSEASYGRDAAIITPNGPPGPPVRGDVASVMLRLRRPP